MADKKEIKKAASLSVNKREAACTNTAGRGFIPGEAQSKSVVGCQLSVNNPADN
jgi:hypothetical protein